MNRLTREDLLEPFVTLEVGTPATMWHGYTSSGSKAVIVKVERFKGGNRAGCVKALEARLVAIDGTVTNLKRRYTVRPNGDVREVGDTYGYSTLIVGEAKHTPYWD
jgi:hypothetical protein